MDKVKPPLHNKTAIAVCSAAGIDLLNRRKVEFIRISNGLERVLAEAEQARQWEEFLSVALLGASLVQATCDAFIGMAATLVDLPLPKWVAPPVVKGVKAVSKFYSGTAALAGSMAAAKTGQKTDWIDTSMKVIQSTMKEDPNNKYDDIINLKFQSADILNAAIQNDNPKVLQVIFLSYLPKIAEMSLKYMDKEMHSKWLSAASAVVNAGYSYSSALDKALQVRLDDQEAARSRTETLAMMRRQLRTVQSKIREIDEIMTSCVADITRSGLRPFGAPVHTRLP